MSIDAKVSFMNQTEKSLATRITADMMSSVMKIIADILESYEMRETFRDVDTNDDLLDSYLSALKVQGRSPKTITRYKFVITQMMKSIGIPTRRITVYHLRSYLASEQERGLMDSSVEGTRQVLSAYFNWLQRESLIDRNPTANLGAIKCAKRKKQILTDVDLYNLKSNCNNSRDTAIVMFLQSTGCRISEITGLNRQDINFTEMKCTVHGKGNKERSAFFDAVTASALKKYFKDRKDDCEALFVNRFGERIRNDGVRFMLKELGKRAGVEHVHPHKFRRTLATELARHGMPIQEVAFVLGHDKIDTTMKYVVQNDGDVRNSYMKYAM